MEDLKKYKEALMYLALIIVMVVLSFKQIQPKVISTIGLYNSVKTQTEAANAIEQQLSVAKQKEERKKKLRMFDDMTKKIYVPNGAATDAESTFALLLDDVIEILRKNHIKTHSIRSVIDPEDDVFIKGDKAHYSANKLDLKIITDYSDFNAFLEDIYRYPYLININTIEVYPYIKNKRILLVNLEMTLYAEKSPEDTEAAENEEKKQEENGGEQQNPEQQQQNPDQPPAPPTP